MDGPGSLYWCITDDCNYRCSYCVQGRGRPDREQGRYATGACIDAVLRFLAGLQKGWIVRLSGGEPSLHPRLAEIAGKVAAEGHRLAMETNLSLPLARYRDFFSAAGGRLANFHASFHAERADAEAFLDKCRCLRRAMAEAGASCGFCVSAVATRANRAWIEDQAPLFEREGFIFVAQREIAGEASAEQGPGAEDSRGRPCLAGKKWLLLDVEGRAWRCHSGLRARGTGDGFLGDVFRGVALCEGSRPCPYAACHCPGSPVV
jgi:hypothetical protein